MTGRDVKAFVKADVEKKLSSSEKAEYKDAIRELANSYEGRHVIAEIVIEDATERYDAIDIASQIGDVRTFDITEDPVVKVRKGLKGAIHAHGSVAERTEWKAEIVRPSLQLLSVNPECLLRNLKKGHIGTLAEMQGDAIDAAQREIGKYIWDLLKSSITAGNNYGSITAANWTAAGDTAKAAAKVALRYVADKGGGVKAIVGRLPALFPLMDMEGFTGDKHFSEEMRRELELQGRAGIFLGAPVVYIEDYFDQRLGNEDISMIDSDNLFVVPKRLGVSTVYVGGFEAQELLDGETGIFSIHVSREFGMLLVHTSRVYRLYLNA